jgi:hypothetical protein
LNCKLIPLDKNHEEYKLVERFINDSKSSDIIEEIFIVERPGEKERYTKKIGNDHLLYHGSRVSNFGGSYYINYKVFYHKVCESLLQKHLITVMFMEKEFILLICIIHQGYK